METIIAAALFLAFSVLLMAVGIIFKKGGKFPETEIEGNKEMMKRGIKCAKQDEAKLWGKKGASASSCSTGFCATSSCDSCAFSSTK